MNFCSYYSKISHFNFEQIFYIVKGKVEKTIIFQVKSRHLKIRTEYFKFI
jgi:hypothetical protein